MQLWALGVILLIFHVLYALVLRLFEAILAYWCIPIQLL